MYNARRFITRVFFLMAIPLTTLAGTPFAPDFILEPYQIESFTQASYRNSTYDINSIILSNKDESRFVDYTQAFSIGLPYAFSVGISETYADPLHKNPLNPSEGKSGFKAPFFIVNKLVDYSDTLKFKLSASFKPNLTESKDDFNTLQVSALAITKVKNDLDLSFGYSRIRYELSNTDADIFTLIASKKFGNDTLLNLSYEQTEWSSTNTTQGVFDSSSGYAVAAEISTNIAKDVWLSLNSSYYYNKCTFTPVFPPILYTNKLDQYTGGVTVKWLF